MHGSREGSRNVALVSIGFFFLFFGNNAAQQYLVILFKQMGQTNLALLSLVALYASFGISGIFVPSLIKKVGGLKISLILGACTYVLFAIAVMIGNPFVLIAESVIFGVGAAFLWIASAQIIVDSSTPHTAGRNLSFQTIGLYTGNIFGVFAGGYLIAHTSISVMYILLAVAMLVSIPFFALIRPVREEIAPRPFTVQYLFDRRMLLLFPILFATYYLQGQVLTAIPLITIGILGIGAIPLIITFVKGSNAIGSYLAGVMADRSKKLLPSALLIIIALIGVGLFILPLGIFPLALAAVLLGLSSAGAYPVCLSWLKEKVTREEYLYALGTFHVYTNIGTVAAITAHLWLPATASFIPAVIAFMVALPCVFLFNQLPKNASI